MQARGGWRRMMAAALLAGPVVIGAKVAPAAAAVGTACDKACLEQTMHSYLDHMVRHDPTGLPLAAKVNSRQNAVATPLGEGAWKTVTKVRAGDIVADPQTGQVVFYGAVDTDGRLGSIYLRLKLNGRRIAESEIYFNGGEPGAFFDPTGLLEPDLLYQAVVPPDRRASREQLTSIIHRYVDSISQHKGDPSLFSYRCDRFSAGSRFTNNPEKHPFDKEGGTCASSLDRLTGQPSVGLRIAALDVPRGVTAMEFIIPHGERAKPSCTYVAEVFKVVDGKIRSIEEFSFSGPYPPNSGFGP